MTKNPRNQRLRALVIEDDREVSKLIKHNLENKDLQVVEAATGIDGIRILSEARVDLVLLDLKLPDFSGWGILGLIRLTEALRDLPVIVTSIEPPKTVLMAQLQPDEYIQKPFDMRDLLLRVSQVMSLRNTKRQGATKII